MVVKTTNIRNVEPIGSDALADEFQTLFNEAVSARFFQGGLQSLKLGYIRQKYDNLDGPETELIPVLQNNKEQCGCSCGEEETCSLCEPVLEEVCSLEDAVKACQNMSPFKGLANLIATVKKYEYISLAENAYAPIGNKPFKLEPTKDAELNEEEKTKASQSFFAFLKQFLAVNEIRINEIPAAFNLSTLGEVTRTLQSSAQGDADIRVREALNNNEIVLEKIFQRSNYMGEYLEVIKDTVDMPLGIMWIDDKQLKKTRKLDSQGKMFIKYDIQCDAKRIDPCYFWATEDYELNKVGRAVFKLEQFTKGDILRWKSFSVTGSEKISESIDSYLETNPDGYRMQQAMLFNDHNILKKGLYDVLISRGKYTKEYVNKLGLDIPEIYKDEDYVPCELYFSGSEILRGRVMMCTDENLGVYTTVFRRRGQSIFGYSLHDFIYPFAKLYEGNIDAIDVSMGKSVGSLIQVDTGVIKDPQKYLVKNEKTGEVTLDLSDDTIIEFDSTEAAFTSPNFKGVPITIEQLPSDLNKLLPLVDFIFKQLEVISGIPSILVNANNVASALRTDSNFNAAFAASAQVIKSLLREPENRILEPSIQYFFDSKAADGSFGQFLIETEPEILLSDTLTRERNDDRNLVNDVLELQQFQSVPREKIDALINMLGREVYNLNEDLIPGVNPLSTSRPATNLQSFQST